MPETFDEILDNCIDRINQGEGLEECLASYPQYADEIRPLLQAMADIRTTYSFTPTPAAKSAARQRFNYARQQLDLKRRERQPFFAQLFGRPKVWVTAIAIIIIIAIGGYVGLRLLSSPAGTGSQPDIATPPTTPSTPTTPTTPTIPPLVSIPQPNHEGNFAFFISDDVNAIKDFESVNVTISTIGVQEGNDSDQWLEFEPETKEVDLTLVQGEATQQIWRGDLPQGQYHKVFIHVSDVRGILKDTNEEIEIKLPSQKLQLSQSFTISPDTVTSFTFDLTVVAAGSSQSGIKYLLQPQAAQSGAKYKPAESKEKGPKE